MVSWDTPWATHPKTPVSVLGTDLLDRSGVLFHRHEDPVSANTIVSLFLISTASHCYNNSTVLSQLNRAVALRYFSPCVRTSALCVAAYPTSKVQEYEPVSLSVCAVKLDLRTD